MEPTDRELEALKALWSDGPSTVRDIWKRLLKQRSDLAYTTVLSLLQVMEQKGMVSHETSGRAYLYSATVPKEKAHRKLTRRFLDDVFDGSIDQFVARLLESKKPDAKTLDALDRLIDEHRRGGSKTKKGATNDD